ncbi:hypothetical protein FQA39_LY05803 [Lamprigera yunnana]|nr:hypothetical protein FQA39_LY05803 [Lamprigera yunnana]
MEIHETEEEEYDGELDTPKIRLACYQEAVVGDSGEVSVREGNYERLPVRDSKMESEGVMADLVAEAGDGVALFVKVTITEEDQILMMQRSNTIKQQLTAIRDFKLIDDGIFKEVKVSSELRQLCVITKSMQKAMCVCYHNNSRHLSVAKTATIKIYKNQYESEEISEDYEEDTEELNIDESSKEEESFVNVSARDASESTVPVQNVKKNAERVRKVPKRF